MVNVRDLSGSANQQSQNGHSVKAAGLHASASSSLIKAPLLPIGALNEHDYPRERLTPALGIKFAESVRLRDILELPVPERDAVLRDLSIEISRAGVAFFSNQHDITPDDLAKLGLLLGELSGKERDSSLHIHPTQELAENGLPIGKISNVPDKDGRQISFMASDRSILTSSGWHSDVSFEPVPALFTLLKMHTLPSTGGDTLWASQYAAYESLSPAYQQFLKGLTTTHDAERFREQARLHGYKLRTAPRGHPDNAGDAFQARHPVIRTNPVTGWNALYVNPTFTARINELSYDESRATLDYLFRLQHEMHGKPLTCNVTFSKAHEVTEHHVKYRWSKNDLAIWNNSTVNHLATFDYTETRIGDRVVVCGEHPYLDPNAKSRQASSAH